MMRISPDVVRLGRVVGLSGLRGWIKVYSYTAPREGIVGYRHWLLGCADDWREQRVLGGKRRGPCVTAQLKGVEDRESAAALLDLEIAVPRDTLPPLGAGQYYWTDLQGLLVRRQDGMTLGRVVHLLETGAHDVMVVNGEHERLIPFAPGAVVLDVDLDAGVIRVDWDWD